MHSLKNCILLVAACPTFGFAPFPCIKQRWGYFGKVDRISSSPQTTPIAFREKHYRGAPITLQASLSPAVDIGLISTSVAILSGYHLSLFCKERSSDTKTWRQYQADTRENWARHVRDTEGWLYGIQSLRNAMTAQSFLASTVLSLLTLITGRVWDILRASTDKWERRLLTAQLASISTTMLFSGYQFLQGVRLMTHAGFMFPVNGENTKVDNIMRKTQNCQWLGLRSMYLSLAPNAWVVGGSRAFFVVACFLLMFFRSIDKKPEGLGYEDFQGLNI